MDLEEQKKALEKMLNYVNGMMASSVKAVNDTTPRDPVLLSASQGYCQLLENKRVLEEELARVVKAAIPHQPRRN